jgi:hypothetical protein
MDRCSFNAFHIFHLASLHVYPCPAVSFLWSFLVWIELVDAWRHRSAEVTGPWAMTMNAIGSSLVLRIGELRLVLMAKLRDDDRVYSVQHIAHGPLGTLQLL